ncbi:hypothetical protein LCGC14_0587280 [marine sediment metagenome]|uniref:Uncharacterized protein n=1 Tax=marine sediment metagenome TaxID=412755 RepID=A0A0F9RYE4_9ZZZZ|nr:hypothetical protein [bacterium]
MENKRLKQEISSLETKILSLVGMFTIESSGGQENKNVLNDQLVNLIGSTKEQLNIVTPKIDGFYANQLKKVVQKGIPVLLITNDRGDLHKSDRPIYDDLKMTEGISIINNPNVRFLLLFNTTQAIYAGGSLNIEELSKSILIITTIQEKSKLRKIAKIFSLMLPTFMRK